MHEHARRMDLLRIQFARFDEGFHFGNRDPSGHRSESGLKLRADAS